MRDAREIMMLIDYAFQGVATLLFLSLKLTHCVTLSWWWIAIPLALSSSLGWAIKYRARKGWKE